jgi:hypothetical protein
MSSTCIRSGFCCRQGTCPFGKWDEVKYQCAYLEGDAPGSYACGIYDQIAQHPDAELSPAFGSGCSSSLNPVRVRMLT